jgi:predicted phage-related endonuclease
MSNDFIPEIRNSGLWSNDMRRLVQGKGGEVAAEKWKELAPPDLSNVEAVQMGHVMQFPIMQEFARRQRIEFKDADYMLTHPKHEFLKSHFDYISDDGKTLYEIKNLGIHQRKKYGDDGSDQVDIGYRAQCVHEATVHQIKNIVLVVCFGGQEIVHYPLTITADIMDAHIQLAAEFWAKIQTRTFDPETMGDAAKTIYKVDNGSSVIANQQVETLVAELRQLKDQIKQLEKLEEQRVAAIQGFMMESSQLSTFDGSVLATWKASKSSKRFSADLLKAAMPEIYDKFVVEQPGSRRFLVK